MQDDDKNKSWFHRHHFCPVSAIFIPCDSAVRSVFRWSSCTHNDGLRELHHFLVLFSRFSRMSSRILNSRQFKWVPYVCSSSPDSPIDIEQEIARAHSCKYVQTQQRQHTRFVPAFALVAVCADFVGLDGWMFTGSLATPAWLLI
jgi:hypothetical protein